MDIWYTFTIYIFLGFFKTLFDHTKSVCLIITCCFSLLSGIFYIRDAPSYILPKALLPVYWWWGWKIHPQPNISCQSTRTGGHTVKTLRVRITLVQLYCYVNYHSCHRKTFMGHCKSCLEGKIHTFIFFPEMCLFTNLENSETHYSRKKWHMTIHLLFFGVCLAASHYFSAWFG